MILVVWKLRLNQRLVCQDVETLLKFSNPVVQAGLSAIKFKCCRTVFRNLMDQFFSFFQKALTAEVKKMKKADIESKVYSQYDEQFQGLAWIALVLLLIDLFIIDRKNSWLKKITFFSENSEK